jgi:subtilisin family serine protease
MLCCAVQEGAKVISMSLGGGYSDSYPAMAASIQDAGALLVAAAGNGEPCCRTLLVPPLLLPLLAAATSIAMARSRPCCACACWLSSTVCCDLPAPVPPAP